MIAENIISLESIRLKAQVYIGLDNRKTSLRPCDTDLYPEVNIKFHRDIREYKMGDTLEVDVVVLQSSNGHCYFYSY
jgi:hypothetical protein